MKPLYALSFLIVVLIVVGCAAVAAQEQEPPPLKIKHVAEVMFFERPLPCYQTKHGVRVFATPEAGCPERAEVESLTDEVLTDSKVKASRYRALQNTILIFTDSIMTDGTPGTYILGVTIGDRVSFVTINDSSPRRWQGVLKHEILHAVKWYFLRDSDNLEKDPRFQRYVQE